MAFQNNAFQNDAFQVAGSGIDTHDGVGFLPEHIRKRLKKRPLGNLLVIYDEAIETLPKEKTSRIKSVVKSFSPPAVETPKSQDIEIDYLRLNDLAYSIFLAEIDKLKSDIAAYKAQKTKELLLIQQQDDELLFTIAGIA